MMSLAIARRLPQLLELQRERTWQPLRGRELSELTIGIVGYGSIGVELSRLLAPFGSRILATRRHPERGAGDASNVELHGLDRLDEVLRASDIVVVAAPLTDETAGLIGAEQLAQMREDAWLINIARGRLIDEIALRRALQSGWIGGAVLDVFSEEPLAPDSPLYDHAQPRHHAAHQLGVRPRRGADRRPVRREPAGLPGGRADAQRRRPRGRLLAPCRSPSSGFPAAARRPSSTR